MNPAFLALLVGAFFTGVTPLAVRFVEIDPAAGGFWRTALTLPLFLAWRSSPSEAAAQPMSARDRGLLVLGGAAYGADIAVWFWAIHLTSAVNAQLFAYCYPLWVALAGTLLLGQRLPLRGWIAIALGLTGSALLIIGREGGIAMLVGGDRLLGDGFAILAGLLYSVTMLAQGTVRTRVGTRRVLLATMAVASLVMLPAGLLGSGAFLPSGLGQWGLVVLLAVMTFAAQGLVVYALGRLPVMLAGVAGSLGVAVTATGGWMWLGETLGFLQLLGIAVVLAAVPMAERAARTKTEPRGAALSGSARAVKPV